MPYLLDTNVLSEARKPVQNPGVTAWLAATSVAEQHICVLTVGEIGRGIARLRRRGDDEQAQVVESWLGEVVEAFGPRIVPINVDIALEWARQDPRRPPPTVDALIGATAAARRWTLVTRNTKDFEHLDVELLNPFTEEAGS